MSMQYSISLGGFNGNLIPIAIIHIQIYQPKLEKVFAENSRRSGMFGQGNYFKYLFLFSGQYLGFFLFRAVSC